MTPRVASLETSRSSSFSASQLMSISACLKGGSPDWICVTLSLATIRW
jgi:hypothetical protein